MKSKKGFTLIELLIVVLIIAILSAIGLSQYTFAVAKTRASEALLNLKALYTAQELNYMANGGYSTNFSDLAVSFGRRCTGQTCPHGRFTYELNYLLSESQLRASDVDFGNIPNGQFLIVLFTDKSPIVNSQIKKGDIGCFTRNKIFYDKVCRALGGKVKLKLGTSGQDLYIL